MGIKSTQTIKRSEAITRIKEIVKLAKLHAYDVIEQITTEFDYKIEDKIKEIANTDIRFIDNWTNKMLRDKMDEPFFRYSMFDNYWVVYDEDYNEANDNKWW